MQMSEEPEGGVDDDLGGVNDDLDGVDDDLGGVEESTPTIGHSRRLHSAPLGTLH